MSNIFTRIKDAISADIHQLLDEKEQKNPIASLNHYIRQSEQQKLEMNAWQGLGDSNPRPSVLETDALPTELYP